MQSYSQLQYRPRILFIGGYKTQKINIDFSRKITQCLSALRHVIGRIQTMNKMDSHSISFPLPSHPLQTWFSALSAFGIFLITFSLLLQLGYDVPHHKSSFPQAIGQLYWLKPEPSRPQVAELPARHSPKNKTLTTTNPTKLRPRLNTKTEPTQNSNETVTTPSTHPIEKDDLNDAFKTPQVNKDVYGTPKGGLDSRAIALAYQNSQTEIEKMAEKSGKPLIERRKTKHDRFHEAAAKAAKPECVRPGGAGILSLFVIAYEVAADKCK